MSEVWRRATVRIPGVDSELASAVDFGAIAVYTCSESCAPTAAAKEEGISAAYAEEIVLVHPPLNA